MVHGDPTSPLEVRQTPAVHADERLHATRGWSHGSPGARSATHTPQAPLLQSTLQRCVSHCPSKAQAAPAGLNWPSTNVDAPEDAEVGELSSAPPHAAWSEARREKQTSVERGRRGLMPDPCARAAPPRNSRAASRWAAVPGCPVTSELPVIVNGVGTVEAGEHPNARAGRALRLR
jgi:hypothetical protein